MRHRWLGAAAAGVAAMALIGGFSGRAGGQEAPPPAPADPASCRGVLGQSGRLPAVLSGVTRYGSTYVLVVPQRLAEKVPNAASPGVKDLEVGVQAGSAGRVVATALGITRIHEYGSDAAPAQPLQDVKDATLDAAILWAPLAGAAIIELGMDADVSIYAVDRPRSAPASFRAASSNDPCSAAIRDELDASGVLPAELLVTVDVRDLLRTRHAPPLDMEQARQGGPVFDQTCSRCHGANAVADPHGLAPVDLRISITRFSFPAFNYIVLNGRPSKSMPPFRGSVSDDQIVLIYQYLKARSMNLLPATTTAAGGPGSTQTTTQTEAHRR
jgi:mono/diheme cytochrome c family protein